METGEQSNKKWSKDIDHGDNVADSSYEPVEPEETDKQGYLLPKHEHRVDSSKGNPKGNVSEQKDEYFDMNSDSQKFEQSKVQSIYQELKIYNKKDEDNYFSLKSGNDQSDEDSIYDEVETVIPMQGAKIIPIGQPQSAYDEVIINGGRYVMPSTTWDTDSEAFESDFDDEEEVQTYFGDHLDRLYENVEERKIVSPKPRTMSFTGVETESNDDTKHSPLQQDFRSCLPFSNKSPKQDFGNALFYSSTDDGNIPLYVDANTLGNDIPVMPPIIQTMTNDERTRYNIVSKILKEEAIYIDQLNTILEIHDEVRKRRLLDDEKIHIIFCSVNNIHQCHEMFNTELAERMNQWTVIDSKLGDIICAAFSKVITSVAYTEFVTNFALAIDTYRTVCKTNSVFAQFVSAKENNLKPKITFHELMLKPFERFPNFILLIQDLLEVTPVEHKDRVPLQLALTQLECLCETINIRRKETEIKYQVKCLDSQISQLNQPLSSSGRVFLRQDDMVHCLIEGASVVGTKKLRLVLLSDMLLCLSPISKKKNIVSGLLNMPKYKYKLKWNVPLLDVQLIDYGTGVNVAASKYGTVTKYSNEGKYRQATSDIQRHIEDLQHDMAVIGQIAALTTSLRGKHEQLDIQKVEEWYKTVENTINEEMKVVNMFWLEISLPTRSGQQNYVFNLSSPTIKQEWDIATRTAKLALEPRNNPGWFLPDEEETGGLSILRRNMPLLDEYFELFIFNNKSRVEQTLTYPISFSEHPKSMSTNGLGHYLWFSSRGELQGNVTVLQLDNNSSLPRCIESFNVCSGTVYSMAFVPTMNTRPDQTSDKYKGKYGFPFPTIWLGCHSNRIYVFNAESKERNQPLLIIKLRDAPLDMKYTRRKIYVGLANGTLAIFRSTPSGVWNFYQPSILPLGRYPVAVVSDIKDKLWCGSGSQIYVVNKTGDRIQNIIAVDSNMKNLVKHIVGYGVGVWISVWRKSTIKLYHAETCELVQEVNVVSPVTTMKNCVDSQVQYLATEKTTVTALLIISGFLWVGTNLGLILLYPLPKLQGIPRVIGHACIAFHAHSGPVRNLFAVHDGPLPCDDDNDDTSLTTDENQDEMSRELNLLVDSDDSVQSDEEFYFVDDSKTDSKRNSSKQKKSKVSLKKSETVEKAADSQSDVLDMKKLKLNDFAKMIEKFSGFLKDEQTSIISDEQEVVDAETKVESPENRAQGEKPQNMQRANDQGRGEGLISGTVVPVGSTSSVVEPASAEPDDKELNIETLGGSEGIPPGSSVDEERGVLDQDPTVCDTNQVVTKEKPPRTRGVNQISPEVGVTAVEPIYVNLPQVEKREPGNGPLENGNLKETNDNDDGQLMNSSIETVKNGSGKPEDSQGMYTVVLPDEKEDVMGETEPEAVSEMMGNRSVKRETRARSYVVFSAGEGHVDLRLKVKSKGEIKKDNQTKLLIWRVNNKT